MACTIVDVVAARRRVHIMHDADLMMAFIIILFEVYRQRLYCKLDELLATQALPYCNVVNVPEIGYGLHCLFT